MKSSVLIHKDVHCSIVYCGQQKKKKERKMSRILKIMKYYTAFKNGNYKA